VLIFSSMHESGQREYNIRIQCACHLTLGYTELNQLTGVAALLTFPLDVEVVELEEREAKEEAERKKAGEE
jgi:protein pelota